MSTRASAVRRIIGVFFCCFSACGGGGNGAEGPHTSPPSAAEGGEGSNGVRVEAQIAAFKADCAPGREEVCNALDDDCNGVIDDGCGYRTGGVQITVAWNTAADIDLYVNDPSGDTLYYNEEHERSSIGGHLDHNARGDCRREQKNSRVENAYWPAPAPSGNYSVALHYFSPCASSAVTKATISVAVGGKLIGSYQATLKPEQRIEALSIDVP